MSDEREVLEVETVIVGAGPAGLAAAYRLQQLIQEHNEQVAAGKKAGPDLSEAMVAVLEKGASVGDHMLSGAVMDTGALKELIPDFAEKGCPGIECTADEVVHLSKSGSRRFPFTPKWLHNKGHRILSLNRLVRWMNERLEETGTEVFASFPAAELLIEDDRVVGVRTGDKGIDHKGEQKANFEPGMEVRAKVTILAEGTRGSLTKILVDRFGLDKGKNPQVYGTGVKEVWRVPGCDQASKGHVLHTMGWPLGRKDYGGGFVYYMGEDLIQIGYVVGLGRPDPASDPHRLFQEFKRQPKIRALLKGGERLRYGAKSLPMGGWWSRPKSFVGGCLIVGDAGSNLNPARLKGIHLAIKTGMLAAETAFEALCKDDASAATMAGFERRIEDSWVKEEMYSVRNVHQALEKGLPLGLFDLALQMVTSGRGLRDRYASHVDHGRVKKVSEFPAGAPAAKPDGALTFDKLTDVYHSGTTHEEDQPCHLVVTVSPDHCRTTCSEEYGNPCQHFCPASVYEMVEDPAAGGKSLQINASNCVHCKTCDILDPYLAIEWTVPEGGGGPIYTDL
ncbi:MAG: electron transfer flavoprotein-ubiquinone oxidoreductase [Planctomycetota bacterium]